MVTLLSASLLVSLSARLVTFRYVAPTKVASIVVVGQFNNWDRARNPLQVSADGVTWSAQVSIEPGVYQYLFCENGNRWFADPSAPKAPDTNGNVNSQLIVTPLDFDSHAGKAGDGDITASALLHHPTRENLMRLDASSATATLRTRRNDIESVSLVTWNNRKRKTFPADLVAQDELYDTWRATFGIEKNGPTRYAFLLKDGGTTLWYSRNQAAASPRPYSIRLDKFSLPSPPDWVKHAVFYQIFPDRFADGDPSNNPPGTEPWLSKPTAHNLMGGDLKGVEQHLRYLKELGINALYLNPIFKSSSNHGYDTADYFEIEPRLGTKEDLRRLVATAHKMGMHVILDGVFNHAGISFAPFQDLLKNQEKSRYRNWFHVLKYPVQAREGQQTYKTFGGVWRMPKWNQENPAARRYLLSVATYWIREAGIDGWRLDVADEVPHSYWKAFRLAVRREKPSAYILGEEWGDAHSWMQGDEHDAAMNYPWRRAVLDFFGSRQLTGKEFSRQLKLVRTGVPAKAVLAQFNLLGSHDTRRLADELGFNEKAIDLALVFQFTYPGAPSVYYGDEIGLTGGPDPACRGCMPWERADWNHSRHELVANLARLRTSVPALATGSYKEIPFSRKSPSEQESLFGFERKQGKQIVTVILNRSSDSHGVVLPTGRILLSDGYDATNHQMEAGGYVIIERA